jgi:drug/metabolite transporter (DMT)-like permease
METLGWRTVAAVVIALVAISFAPPLIAYAAAPGLAIAFWRNALAVGVLAPVAATRRRHEVADLIRTPDGRRVGLVCVFAGVWLAVHFGSWVPSVKLTSVATATALVATTPVWTALIAVTRGVHVPRATWLGIACTVVGAALATGVDFTISTRAVLGDILALVGGFAGAVYIVYGERARASLSTTAYTTVCYATCAALLAAACLVGGVSLVGYAAGTWLAIAALTIGPQLLGHSLFNYTLKKLSATTVSVITLLEVPGATLIGWLWLDQLPDPRSVPGLVILVLGVVIVIVELARTNRTGQRQPTNGGTEISPEAIGTT